MEVELGSLPGGDQTASSASSSVVAPPQPAAPRPRAGGRTAQPAVCGECHLRVSLTCVKSEQGQEEKATCYRCNKGKSESESKLELWECPAKCQFFLHADCHQVELDIKERPRHLKQSLEYTAADHTLTMSYDLAVGGLVLPLLGGAYFLLGMKPLGSTFGHIGFSNGQSYLFGAVAWFGLLAAISKYCSQLPRPQWHTCTENKHIHQILEVVAPWSPILGIFLFVAVVCFSIRHERFFTDIGPVFLAAFLGLVSLALVLRRFGVGADSSFLYDLVLIPGYFVLVAPIVPAVYAVATEWPGTSQPTSYRDLLVRMLVAAIFGPIAVTCYWTMRRPSKHGWHTDPETYVMRSFEDLVVRQPKNVEKQHISHCIAFEISEIQAECRLCHGSKFKELPPDTNHECKQCVGFLGFCWTFPARWQCFDHRCDYHLCEKHHNLRLAKARPSFFTVEKGQRERGAKWPTLWQWRRISALLVPCQECNGPLISKLRSGECNGCHKAKETHFACPREACKWHLCEECAKATTGIPWWKERLFLIYRFGQALFRNHKYLYVFAQETRANYGQLFRCRIYSGWIGVWDMLVDALFEGAFSYLVIWFGSQRFKDTDFPCQSPVYNVTACQMPCVNDLNWLPPNRFAYTTNTSHTSLPRDDNCQRYPQVVDLGILFQCVSLGIMIITCFTGFYNLYLLVQSFADLTDSVNTYLWQFDPDCVDPEALKSSDEQPAGAEPQSSRAAGAQPLMAHADKAAAPTDPPSPTEPSAKTPHAASSAADAEARLAAERLAAERQKVAQKAFLRHMINIRSAPVQQTEKDGLLVEYHLDWLPVVPSRKAVERLRKRMEPQEEESSEEEEEEVERGRHGRRRPSGEEISWEWWFRYHKALLETVDFYYWRVWYALIGLLILWIGFMVDIIVSARNGAYSQALTKDFAAIAYAMVLYGLPVMFGVVLGAQLNEAMDLSLKTIAKFVQSVEDKQYLEWAQGHPRRLQLCLWEMNLNMVLTAGASIFSGVFLLASSSN